MSSHSSTSQTERWPALLRTWAEEVCNLEEYLEGIVQEWIELWKKVGGIEEVFEE